MWRAHQAQAIEMWEDVERHLLPAPSDIFASICCGGGKEAFAGIMAHYAIERLHLAAKFIWITPRVALRTQAAESLDKAEWLAQQLGHGLRCYESTNNLNPSKGGAGFTTTYQALLEDAAGINRQELERSPYMVILDEFHHLFRGGEFAKAVEPLLARARLRVWMSGTLDRGDRRPIHGLPYRADGYVDDVASAGRFWIHYRLADALSEHAIVRPEFVKVEGRAEWKENGENRQVEALGSEWGARITALHTAYATQLLDSCLKHWLVYRVSHHRSKLLVVCADKKQARKILAALQARGVERVAIAVSSESPQEYSEARGNIRRFKGKRLEAGETPLDVLVTVAMAYEGLDVPAITHLVCLTHIRSRPWIAQMFARAWRYDAGSNVRYEDQRAFIWVPNDVPMQLTITEIEQELTEPARMSLKPPPKPGDGPGDRPETPDIAITPGSSEATHFIAYEMHGAELTAVQTMRYLDVAQRAGVPLSPTQLHAVVRELERSQQQVAVGIANGHAASALPARTPQDEYEYCRTHLNNVVDKTAHRLAEVSDLDLKAAYSRINVSVIAQFGQRDALDTAQLEAAAKWVLANYDY